MRYRFEQRSACGALWSHSKAVWLDQNLRCDSARPFPPVTSRTPSLSWPRPGAFRCLLERVLVGLMIELLLATDTTKIEGFSAKLGLVLRPAYIHRHSADRVCGILLRDR
jgi:hypothetical protein